MTRHAMVQPSVAGTQPSAKDPHTSVVIIEADKAAPSRATGQKRRTEAQRSGQSASIPPLPEGGRAIADISRKSKSP